MKALSDCFYLGSRQKCTRLSDSSIFLPAVIYAQLTFCPRLHNIAIMSEERYDLVIFGATGFTGQFVVEELVRVQDEESGGLTMAVAGRNMEKLQKVLEQASKQTGIGLQQILFIKAEAIDIASE